MTGREIHVHAHEHPTGDARGAAVRRARQLNLATIVWTVVEAGAALWAGIRAGSVSLTGFGFDSVIEVSAAVILAWRLFQERRDDCTQPSDRLATRAIAVSFVALAIYVTISAVATLAGRRHPDSTVVGIVVAAAALLVMPALARAKRRLAPALGSTAVVADAKQTNLCALLSACVVTGLVANAALGWWWADPVAGLAIAGLAARESVRTWNAESLADTCCA